MGLSYILFAIGREREEKEEREEEKEGEKKEEKEEKKEGKRVKRRCEAGGEGARKRCKGKKSERKKFSPVTIKKPIISCVLCHGLNTLKK